MKAARCPGCHDDAKRKLQAKQERFLKNDYEEA